jgi:hypothetical protein
MQQKITLKKELSIGDWLIVCSNLFAIYGVWMLNWDAKIIFLVFCLETIIIGIINFLQLWLITITQNEEGKKTILKAGYFLMLFFLVHYGIFVFTQLNIFLTIMKIHKLRISVTDFLFSLNKTLPEYAILYLGLFIVSYFLGVIKDFVFSGKYKTTSLTAQMFTPYKRIFIQQFVVILGAFVLLLNPNGKYLILLFVPIKIFFELFIDYDSLLDEMNKDI